MGVWFPPVVMSKAAQSLIVQQTDLPEKRAQKAGLEKEAASLLGAKTKCSKVRRNPWLAGWNGDIEVFG